ncbi:hypothetical protein N7495_007961 [Penicillium taxi]|uniref:uncharacterized protein n=1 Tax=Penicillium taxi TaxID=168475 RepID=UPI0025457964|nr:uncharacterized protein N7495_007961 [Penicillium taxi]KAJ5887920.1 hypothetical protein N7495_007961 [Penicillium taxi]
MEDAAPALSPLRSGPLPMKTALNTVTQRPIAPRSVSLPTDAPHSDGQFLHANAASSNLDNRPSSARSVRSVHSARKVTKQEEVSPVEDDNRTIRSLDDRSLWAKASSLRSVPNITVNENRPRTSSRPRSAWSERKWTGLRKKSTDMERPSIDEPPPVPPIEPAFSRISMDIPAATLEGLGSTMKFSHRGSLIKNHATRPHFIKPDAQSDQLPEEASEQQSILQPAEPEKKQEQEEDTETTPESSPSIGNTDTSNEIPKATPRLNSQRTLRPRSSITTRAISADDDMLSRRVRLMYEMGNENVTDSDIAKSIASENGVLWEEPATSDIETASTPGLSLNRAESNIRASVEVDRKRIKRETMELGGGIEDWRNIGSGQVDRYGFIHTPANNGDSEPRPIQRVTTSLQLASEAPRRKRSIRPPSARASVRSSHGLQRNPSFNSTFNRPSTSASTASVPIRRSSRLRSATNHLPQNRDRKVTDEAGDMLTLPWDDCGEGKDTPAARARRKKEWQREDKWTNMAKLKKNSHYGGGGMNFEFDTRSPKLIERTWKGIPDRWRATAWYSFLESSAKQHEDSPSEVELIEAYHEFQYISSPDDVQIDIDVPRTISSHIMFRRRYRGGQRLLFRVLHAMSLYYPDNGYVQGMAALAATLLAYYDEEHSYVVWKTSTSPALLDSWRPLDDFEREWLAGGEVAAKLNEVGIPPTAYGTRWYLTLFNYSIPFPAQLRVWDVFMLLGDAEDKTSISRPAGKAGVPTRAGTFGQGLDVIHATSAALIDGMREIILDSDFENAMKVLTSWVPIKDTELFMRVAKAEWKVHRKKHY